MVLLPPGLLIVILRLVLEKEIIMGTLTRRHLDNLMAPRLTTPVASLDALFRNLLTRPLEAEGMAGLKVDIREDDHQYRIHADLPGFKKENIKIEVDGDVVAITAENHEERDIKEGEKIVHCERFTGRTTRTFRLGCEVDERSAHASFTDGVLELTLPKKVDTTSRANIVIE